MTNTTTPEPGRRWNPDAFVDWLLCTTDLAQSTITNYRSYATRWGRWAQTRDLDPLRPEPEAVREWSATLPTSVSTRDMAKATIKRLCEWEDIDDVSGAVGKPEKNTRNRRMPLTRGEARKLMGYAHTRGDQGTAVIIPLTTGMRVSEIALFRWSNINWSNRQIRFYRPKTDSWHTIPLAKVLAERLQETKPLDGLDGFVLESPTKGYRSTQGLRNWIKDVASGCGLDWVQPHDLRRTAGRAIYEASDRDITVAQRLLGHAKVDTTSLYIRADMDGVAEAVDDCDYWGEVAHWGQE